jgi:hypothetical protein
LGRSGKRREALVLLWEVVVKNVIFPSPDDDNGGDNGNIKKPEEVWSELYERIASISDATDLVDDTSNNIDLNIQLLDAVQRLDMAAYAPVVISSSSSSSSSSAEPPKKAVTPSGKGSSTKSKGKASKSKGTTATKTTNKNVFFSPVTDETVLNTLAVTLRLEGLSDTLSEMFFQAMETGNCDEHVIEEAVCVHFQAVCDCTEFLEMRLMPTVTM